MNVKGLGRKEPLPIEVPPGTCLNWLREFTKNLRQGCGCTGKNSNRAHSEYKFTASVLHQLGVALIETERPLLEKRLGSSPKHEPSGVSTTIFGKIGYKTSVCFLSSFRVNLVFTNSTIYTDVIITSIQTIANTCKI
jgi:hypothetical protein